MSQYTDKNGTVVSLGDILKYDEGTNYRFGLALHEVVEYKRVLAGVHRVGYPFWTVNLKHHPVPLTSYCRKPNGTMLIDAEVIGNVKTNPEMLTAEYAEKIFGLIESE